MTTTKDLILGVNETLEAKYPNSVFSTDDKKKIKNGSFRVETPYPIVSLSACYRIEEGTIRIYYFPKDEKETRLEFLEKRQELEELFSHGVTVGGILLPIAEMEFSNVDDVLVLSFDYCIGGRTEDPAEATAEIMENLEFD